MNNNFLQVGKTIECGNCHPDKFEDCKIIAEKYETKCLCICHDVKQCEHWFRELMRNNNKEFYFFCQKCILIRKQEI